MNVQRRAHFCAFVIFAAISLVLPACSPSPDTAIATAVAGTVQAQFVQTDAVATQVPTTTPTPEVTTTPTPEILCVDIAVDYLLTADDLLDRWDDAVAVADSTGRIALSGPVAELQALRREAATLEPPPCVADAHLALGEMMDHTIEGFLLFMRQESDSVVSAEIKHAGEAADRYRESINTLIAEIPEPASAWPNPFVQARIANDPYLTFQEVRNTCFACGKESPLGYWVAADGRILILNSNGTYNNEDQGDMIGRWEVDGDQLCMTTLDDRQTCYAFEQKVDAMMLGGEIYIRQ